MELKPKVSFKPPNCFVTGMTEAIIVTRGDDGWIIGAFKNKKNAKQYINEEEENYETYECDYWKVKVGEGGSTLNP